MGDRKLEAIHKPGPKRSSSSRRHAQKTARTDPLLRWCKVRQGVMPVPETLANDINGKYIKPDNTTTTSSNSNTNKQPASQYQNWTLFLTPDIPKVIVSYKQRTESSLAVYPNMIMEDSGSTKQPRIVVHWYILAP